jgi:hypothetical protein
VEAAARDVPVIVTDQRPDSDGTVRLPAQLLIEQLRQRGHVLAAAEWAVYRLVEGDQLTAEPFDLHSPSFGRQVGRRAMFGAPDTRSVEWVGGASIGTGWTISPTRSSNLEEAKGKVAMPDEYASWSERARQKELQINELVDRRQRAAVARNKAADLPILGIGIDQAEIESYARRLIEIVEILTPLGFREKLDTIEAEKDSDKALALAIYRLARSGKNCAKIVVLLEKLCEPGHPSSSLAVEQWLRQGLVREMLADLLDEPEHPRLHIEQQHNAALACLEALGKLSRQTIKPNESVPEVLAELQRAVQAIPEREEDEFAGASVVQLEGTFGTSWHQVVFKVAQDWAKRLPKAMADTQRLGQVQVCPGLGKDPNELRAALDAEINRVVERLHAGTQDRSAPPDQGGLGQGDSTGEASSGVAGYEEAGELTGDEGTGDARDQHTVGQGQESEESLEFVFVPSGNGYEIKGFGESGHIKKLKGLKVIARLISTPNVSVSMEELVGGTGQKGTDRRTPQVAFDPEAEKKIKAEMRELQNDLTKARKNNDHGEVERVEREIEKLQRHVLQAKGLGGRKRDLNNPYDKLRPRIYSQLQDVYAAMRKAKPPMLKLAEHFELAISSEGGNAYIYRPGPLAPSWNKPPEEQKLTK